MANTQSGIVKVTTDGTMHGGVLGYMAGGFFLPIVGGPTLEEICELTRQGRTTVELDPRQQPARTNAADINAQIYAGQLPSLPGSRLCTNCGHLISRNLHQRWLETADWGNRSIYTCPRCHKMHT